MSPTLNRRDFARLFALGGSAALLERAGLAALEPPPLEPRHLVRGRVDWEAVRAQFLMPPDLAVLNAANLCPSPKPILDAVLERTRTLDTTPVPSVRSEMTGVKEGTRDRLAAFLRVTPEEILITRNTSEANNWVSNGLDLGPGDEVLIVSDNHPSNNRAWKAKAERFGYAVREVPQVNPHPGDAAYLEAFERAIGPATRIVTFMHLSNTAGDLFPAAELCRMARERGIMTLVDGAQSFGLLDVDLSVIDPDFYTGSAHKWPCGPKETGVLFVNRRVHDRFWPSVYSAYTGARGLSRTHEGLGQRDEPAIYAFGRQIEFLQSIGMDEIEARSRGIATMLVEELGALDGVHMWTSGEPDRRAAVVTFRPGELDPRRTLAALEEDGVVAAARGGDDRPGIRFSPHFYNSFADAERAVAAIRRYLRTGL